MKMTMKSLKFIAVLLVYFSYSHGALAANELTVIPDKPEIAALLRNYKAHDGGAIIMKRTILYFLKSSSLKL